MRAVGGTIWLSRGELAELYGTSPQNIGQIIARILGDGEVAESTRNSEFLVRHEGGRQVRRPVDLYNLDMVLAVGYRVTTPRAVQFRQWATTVLKEYLVKGFALQDERLKDPAANDYFDELLQRIREIRASEKRFYQKVRDIFAATSADYAGASGDWVLQADRFLAFNERRLLDGPGRVSASDVEQHVAETYASFDRRRRAHEAERSSSLELEDLQALAELERRQRRDPAGGRKMP